MYRSIFAAFASLLIVSGCDGDSSLDAGAGDAGPASGDGGGSDAGTGTDAGGGDAGAPAPMIVPDVPITNGGDPSWDVVVIEALNIVSDEVGRITNVYGIVRNEDPTLALCSLSPDLHLYDASDTDLGFIGLTVTGAPMQTSIVASCVDSGEIGLVHGSISGVLDLSTIARLELIWFGSGSDTAVPYGDVTSEGEMIVNPFGGTRFFAVEGTVRVSAGMIRNPGVEVMPIVGGLPIARLTDRMLMDYGPGSTYDYTTTSVEAAFTEYRLALDYRAPSAVHEDTPEVRAAMAARDRFDAIRSANAARALPRLAAPAR